MKRCLSLALIVIACFCFLMNIVQAGGPLIVNRNGEPVTWDVNQPVPFTPDLGTLGTLSNSEAVQITNELFNVWANVSTASITFQQEGQLAEDITGSNVLAFFNNLTSDVSPIIFDDDGSITDALNGVGANTNIIGFAGPEFISLTNGIISSIVSGSAVMNGRFFDGLPNPNDLALADFRGTFAHEFGHYIGLAHTQINLDQLSLFDPTTLPLMFPFALDGIGEILQADDVAAVSSLYPTASFVESTGIIQGRVFLPGGVTQFQGANVIARMVSNSKVATVSSFSGVFHLDPQDPGFGGSPDSQLVGFYKINGLEPGDYIVLIEQINPSFSGGSSVGSLVTPVPLPGIPEFFNEGESDSDVEECAGIISVGAGQVVDNIDIVINNPGSTGSAVNEQEPNNSRSDSQTVVLPVTISGDISQDDIGNDLILRSGDDFEDIFSFTIDSTQYVSMFLSFTIKNSDLDLVLVDGNLNTYGMSLGANGVTESLGPIELPPGTYFVGVGLIGGVFSPSTNYTLEIASSCIGDKVPITPVPSPTLSPTPTPTPKATPTPASTEKAQIEVSFDPNPVPLSPQGDWVVSPFIKETNGVGVTITSFEIRGDNGAILLDGNTDDFVGFFDACGIKPNGFIAGFDTACGDLRRTGAPGVDTFIFFGNDENGNSIQANGSVTLLADSAFDKSFTFNCEQSFRRGFFFGLETLAMDVGDTENCTLMIVNHEPGKKIEILSQISKGFMSAIKIEPARGVTDENGELKITITAIREGRDWAAWAVQNTDGEFEFSKEAFDAGLAWGMFVEVKLRE